jgi:hypothetical protein
MTPSMNPATIILRDETRCIIGGNSRGPGAENDSSAVVFDPPRRWQTLR